MANISPSAWQTQVMTAFGTYWTSVNPTVQIQSPNIGFDRAKVPISVLSYVEWFDLGDPAGQIRYSNSTANNFFSRSGRWTFTISIRTKQKSSVALELIDDIGLFYETVVLPDGKFQAIGTTVPLGSDAAWYQVSLSAGYTYFTDRQSTLT